MIEDWDINVAVRQELVKQWVDIRRISFNTIGGVVHIKGTIVFTKSSKDEPLIASIEERADAERKRLMDLEKRIKRVKGVKGTKFNLTDWVKVGNEWKRKTGRG
jgi:HD superfamily phosphodiesterase